MGKERVPQHVAVIMDGNGRWARSHGLPRLRGHEEGCRSVEAAVRACRDLGIRYLTLYAFSVENWKRPKAEVEGLMGLLVRFLQQHEKDLHEKKVRLRAIGRTADLPAYVQKEIARVGRATEAYDDGHLILALAYGGRTEIADAARAIAQKAAAGQLRPDEVDEAAVAAHLYAPDVPDPDLLIRTSGEMRVSNFLLWQISYTELYVTDTPWPEFREEQFRQAVEAYAKRDRRFGDIESR